MAVNKFYDEIYAPDGDVPTLEDYSRAIAQLAAEHYQLLRGWEQYPTRRAPARYIPMRSPDGAVRALRVEDVPTASLRGWRSA